MLLSRRAWAFMMRSMLALQPYSPVTSTHGLSTMRSDTITWMPNHKYDDHEDAHIETSKAQAVQYRHQHAAA